MPGQGFDRTAAIAARFRGIDPPPLGEFLVMTVVCIVVCLGCYFALDGRNATLLASGHRFFCPRLALDDLVPVVPAMIWVYYLHFLAVFGIAVVTTVDRRVMYEGVIGYCGCAILALGCFYLVPSRLEPPDLAACAGMSCRLLDAMTRADNGFNIFPSLHVAQAVVIWLFIRRYQPVLTIPFGLLVVGILASTVLTHRHVLVDVPAGAALALFVYALALRWGTGVASALEPLARWAGGVETRHDPA